MIRGDHIQFLDGFRFLLAFWVFLAHYYTLIGGSRFFELPKFLNESLNKPVVAVYGFMIITGFLMTHNYLARGGREPYNKFLTFKNFWLRRLFRLYPVYIVAVIIAFVTFVPCAELNELNLIYFTGSNVSQWGTVRSVLQPGLADLFTHVFMIHGLFPHYYDSILGVTWSLSLEMQFYLLFPFLFLAVFASHATLKRLLVITLVIFGILALFSPKILDLITHRSNAPRFTLPSILVYVMPFFLLGMVSAGVKCRKMDPLFLAVALILILPFQWLVTNAVIIVFLLFLFLEEMRLILPGYLFKCMGIARSLLSGRLAAFGADISYSMYLIHTLLIGFCIQLVIRHLPSLESSKVAVAIAGLLITLVICFGLGYLIFRFIEKPFIEIGKRVIRSTNAEMPVKADAAE